MTSQASDLAKQVFIGYREQSALLQIEYKDEEDLILENLEQSDLESNQISLASSQKIGSRDTLIKDSVIIMNLGDSFRVEIREKLKFRPPKAYR